MPKILVTNSSPHDQSFEVHGWNGDKNITIKPNATHTISSPDHKKQSGAIIAMHDGHEGEQAEITFNGGNDTQTYDISVIVGAGGNLTIEQVGNLATRKGDPTFMQDLRAHYARATPQTKNSLHNCIHLDSHGLPIRMEAPKSFEVLEKFVRTFANGKVYIGVGAWGPSKGNPEDNKQSSATAGGNKDVHIVYSDQTSHPGNVQLMQREAIAMPAAETSRVEEKADQETLQNGHEKQEVVNGVSEKAVANGTDPVNGGSAEQEALADGHGEEVAATGAGEKVVSNGTDPADTDEDSTANHEEVSAIGLSEKAVPKGLLPADEDPDQKTTVNGEEKEVFATSSDEGDVAKATVPANGEHAAPVMLNQASPSHALPQIPVKLGEPQHNGPGILLSNKSGKETTYYFFNNSWNGNGTGGANFDHPEKPTHLHPHASTFIGLPTSFKGRVQRGKLQPATWVEFQVSAVSSKGIHTGAWGDISLEQGCDGAAMIRSTDPGSSSANGFEHDILAHAPAAACVTRSDGVKCLATTVGNWTGGPNKAAIEYEQKVVGQKHAYIVGGTGTDVVNSKNERLAVDFY